MSPYTQLKSPSTDLDSRSVEVLDEALDRKAEFMDKDGVLRRSSSVTHRMVQRGVSIDGAEEFKPEEHLHDSINTGTSNVEKQANSKTPIQVDQEATLKNQVKKKTEEELKKANRRVAELARRFEEIQQTLHALGDLVDVTENSTAASPSKTNTYIDQEGNLRRRITTSPIEAQEVSDGFVPGPETPPPPTLAKADTPHHYC